jgi:hypothetical protein
MDISNVSGNFVFDMDEVLVDISPSNYNHIRMNWRKYNLWFKDLGPLTAEQVLARPEFYTDLWLLKDSINESPDRDATISLIRKNLLKDFFSADIYAKLEPTEFAKKTIMNKSFIEHNRVSKVYILTRVVGKEMIEFKKKFVRKWFNHPKVELLIVGLDEKKSDVLKRNNVTWNIFVDDELKNIIDFVEAFDIKGKEFLIPKTGYNKIPLVLDLIIKEKGGVYNYFNKK